ncbi:uncharacterized protein LOC131982234 [Centropristis striata]|uniref:uncharacterized protein LOC131982234 n=1 Tax=Centropristis striata TaxID=184440 RepID=UPI0027DF9609|nr:uncharacterized protein LOC131982234 [Centropristis striata]
MERNIPFQQSDRKAKLFKTVYDFVASNIEPPQHIQVLRRASAAMPMMILGFLWISSEKLFQIFESTEEVKGQKIKRILAIKDECDNINIRRECVLKSLIIYLNEDPDSLFKEYLPSAVEDAENDIVTTVMGIHTVRSHEFGEPDDVWVIIEGVKVFTNVGSAIRAFISLFGLIYALDLSFPENLKYTFEFVQKILMNLDAHRLNTKIQQLKIKLFM